MIKFRVFGTGYDWLKVNDVILACNCCRRNSSHGVIKVRILIGKHNTWYEAEYSSHNSLWFPVGLFLYFIYKTAIYKSYYSIFYSVLLYYHPFVILNAYYIINTCFSVFIFNQN